MANSSSVHPPLLWVRTHQIHFGDHCREANIRDIFGENLQLCHICLRLFIGLPLKLLFRGNASYRSQLEPFARLLTRLLFKLPLLITKILTMLYHISLGRVGIPHFPFSAVVILLDM